MTLARFVREGECYPPGYGLAWRCWDRRGGITYPVPLNLIAGFLHDLWLDWQTPKALRDDVWSNGEHAAAFRRGVEAGRALAARPTPQDTTDTINLPQTDSSLIVAQDTTDATTARSADDGSGGAR